MRAKPVGVDITLLGGLFLIVGVVAGFGIVSESMNQLAFGFHVVRSGFIATTALFVIYLFRRRHLFTDRISVTIAKPSVSEGSH